MKTHRPPKNPTQKWAWIIYQLALRGLNFAAIGRSLGVSRQGVYRARYEPRPRMEKAIAKSIGMLPCQIWPERYPECPQNCVHHNEQAGDAQ